MLVEGGQTFLGPKQNLGCPLFTRIRTTALRKPGSCLTTQYISTCTNWSIQTPTRDKSRSYSRLMQWPGVGQGTLHEEAVFWFPFYGLETMAGVEQPSYRRTTATLWLECEQTGVGYDWKKTNNKNKDRVPTVQKSAGKMWILASTYRQPSRP